MEDITEYEKEDFSSSRTDSVSDFISGNSSADTLTNVSLPDVSFTESHLKFLNQQFQSLEPEDILRWCMTTLPSLYQTSAFGLSGLLTLDVLSKISKEARFSHPVEVVFLDTLYHFPETLSLIARIRQRYPDIKLHVYKPDGISTASEFEAKYGKNLWETNDELYDWVAKVEPAQRAYRELQAKAVLTGRRRSQGGKRGDLDVIEIDEAGLIKVNPLANWTFAQVKEYIKNKDVPYNELLDRGYRSIGDWHSTQPIRDGEDERSGRWKGQEKTECGIHNKVSKYAQFLRDQETKAKKQEEPRSQAPEIWSLPQKLEFYLHRVQAAFER